MFYSPDDTLLSGYELVIEYAGPATRRSDRHNCSLKQDPIIEILPSVSYKTMIPTMRLESTLSHHTLPKSWNFVIGCVSVFHVPALAQVKILYVATLAFFMDCRIQLISC